MSLSNPRGIEVKNAWQPFALASQLGLTMGLTSVVFVLGGLFLGRWLDHLWGTRPIATLALLFTGAFAGSLSTYRLAQEALRGLTADTEEKRILGWRAVGGALFLALETTLVISGSASAGLWLGLQMDRTLGTRPLLTMILTVLGIIGGAVGAYLLARRSARGASETPEEQTQGERMR